MLKEEVVDAVKQGKFHIYTAKTIDEGIETLTGTKAGSFGKDGEFEEGTVNAMVNNRFREMAEKLAKFATTAPETPKPREE
jgi:predicted ATP-dependent protease